jgi:branched-chain amino acid transport system permease protein
VVPDTRAIHTSIAGLVMVLLGGIHTVAGPVAGAAVYKFLAIFVTSQVDYWKLVLGGLIILLVVAFPQGIGGFFQRHAAPRLGRDSEAAEGGVAETGQRA